MRRSGCSLHGGGNSDRRNYFSGQKRRKSLFPLRKDAQRRAERKSKSHGCNKVAYAHHKMMWWKPCCSLLFLRAVFYSFSPRTYLDRMNLTVIRPMIFVDEADVIGFQNKYYVPVAKNPLSCRRKDKAGIRKNLLAQLTGKSRCKGAYVYAILSGNIHGWPPRQTRRREG